MSVIMSSKNYRLREAIESDCKKLFDWRNSSFVRKQMANSEVIKYDDHQIWFEKMLTNENHKFYIFSLNNCPIGTLNFKMNTDQSSQATWGFYLSSDQFEKGTGTLLCQSGLKKAAELQLKTVYATVKKSNLKSFSLHKKLGFSAYKDSQDDIYLIKNIHE